MAIDHSARVSRIGSAPRKQTIPLIMNFTNNPDGFIDFERTTVAIDSNRLELFVFFYHQITRISSIIPSLVQTNLVKSFER